MKNFLSVLLIVLTFLAASMPKSLASVPPAIAVRLLYSTANVTGATHVRLIDTAARAIQGVVVSNVSIDPMYLAVGPSSQAYDTETDVALLPAAGTLFFPLPISGGMRVSIKSAGRTATWGELNASFIYY